MYTSSCVAAHYMDPTFSWKDDDVFLLIGLRKANDHLFTGKRGSSQSAWQHIADLLNNGATAKQCRKRWENLQTKYKLNLTRPINAGSNGMDASTWPFFDVMDEYMDMRQSMKSFSSKMRSSSPSPTMLRLDHTDSIPSTHTMHSLFNYPPPPPPPPPFAPPPQTPRPQTPAYKVPVSTPLEMKSVATQTVKRKLKKKVQYVQKCDLQQIITMLQEQEAAAQQRHNNVMKALQEISQQVSQKNTDNTKDVNKDSMYNDSNTCGDNRKYGDTDCKKNDSDSMDIDSNNCINSKDDNSDCKGGNSNSIDSDSNNCGHSTKDSNTDCEENCMNHIDNCSSSCGNDVCDNSNNEGDNSNKLKN